jgi:valyl-tRNA synthetase
MSKSKGNGIDPFEMMQKYGTDALRMSFIFGNKAGQNYRLYEEKIETFRNYCNKLWNMSKFVLMSLENSEFDVQKTEEYKKHVTPEDEVMINKIDMLRKKITYNMENFQFGVAVQDIYESSWHDFADIFIEQIKTRIYTKDKAGNPINTSPEAINSRLAALYTLWYCLTSYLKMLHPFIPFITEKIWQEIPKDPEESETLMYSTWN